MSAMSETRVANPIKGHRNSGLKAPGVVLLQFLLILIFETFEYSFTKVGIFTGLAILAAFAGGLILGRTGTAFSAVVTPPLAFLFATLITIFLDIIRIRWPYYSEHKLLPLFAAV